MKHDDESDETLIRHRPKMVCETIETIISTHNQLWSAMRPYRWPDGAAASSTMM